MKPNRSTKNLERGILITLYKSVVSQQGMDKNADFLLWGASKFLYTQVFESLAGLTAPGGRFANKDVKATLSTENRYLYLYKDNTTNIFPREKLTWIFESISDYPLLVVTILKNENLGAVRTKADEKVRAQTLRFDIFRTIGHGSGVLVIRSKTYSDVLDLLVELNEYTDTYSIAGVQNLLNKHMKFGKKHPVPIFSKIVDTKSALKRSYRAFVTLSFMLQDGRPQSNRVANTLARIKSLRDDVVRMFRLPSSELQIFSYSEIGHYDIEITIQGHIIYLLELLLNPQFGLANVESKFYYECVFEARIAWKTPDLTTAEMDGK